MPTRLIREGLLTSDAVNALSPAAEVLFVRLILIADDYGRHDARPPILQAKMFPLKRDRVSEADVVAWLGECEAAGLVTVYQVAGKPYLEIPKFWQRTRAKVSKCPQPPGGGMAAGGRVPDTCPTHDRHMPDICQHDSEAETEAEAEDPPSEGCPEPGEPAAGPSPAPPVMTLPCVGGGPKEWPLTAEKAREWQEAYPGVDVLAEVRRAKQWLADNPRRRKTYRGMARFVGNWLAGSQDRGLPAGGKRPPAHARRPVYDRITPPAGDHARD
jgi:hypothetical protein